MRFTPRGEWILIAATLLAALGWLASKHIVTTFPAVPFIGWRFLCAGLLLFPLCRHAIFRASKIQVIKTLGLGSILGFGLLVWVGAIIDSNSIGEGAFIASLSLLLVPLLAWLLFKEPPQKQFWFSAPIALCGLIALTANNDFSLDSHQLRFLAAAAVLSFHFTLNQRATIHLPSLASVSLQLIAVGIVGLAVAIYQGEMSLLNSGGGYQVWLWFTTSVMLATALRYWCQTSGQGKLNPTIAAAIMLLEPIWTLLFSVVLLNEQLSLTQLLGCSLILTSLLAYLLRPKIINLS
ncbi:DMT family transporter [Ferrimonas lipolytica]|uniref:DMT family transporter n=1 Tax=Ferrimonas lipolytica TaxID=2724191 RepID=A0A6H1UEM8_9GAMM|nr:DMT family transporter [Ferrimonas lipolytica]QIZ77050.1 DMT family transporter [Ferrimonas lipolytica]